MKKYTVLCGCERGGANVTKMSAGSRRCMSNVAEMVNINVPRCEWGEQSKHAMQSVEMRAIKAVFVKSLVVIGIIPSNLLATVKVAELPTWGTIQISVLS